MIDWTKDTHCIYCEKQIADDAQWDEAERIEKEHGAKSPEVVAYEAQFCWEYPNFQCHNYAKDENELETSDRRIRELLTERDNLLNEVEQLRAALDAERHINSGLQRMVENLAHAGAIKQREAIALRKAMREALQELVALRHGSAMKIIEDALGDDEFCEDGDA